MSIYLAVQNSSAAIPAFKDRGIQNLMPGRMSDIVAPIIQEGCTHVNFSQVVAHGASYIHAQLFNKAITVDSDVRANMKYIVPQFQMFSPQGAFKFQTLGDENIARLNGLGLREDPARKGVYLGTPSSTDLSFVLSLEPARSGVHNGYASPEAYLAYIQSLRLLEIFQYITWVGSRGSTTVIASFKNNSELDKEGGSTVEVMRDGNDAEPTIVKRHFVTWGADGFNDQVISSIIYPISVSMDETKRLPDLRIKFSDTALPGPGLFFPYFTGMVLGDKEIIASTFEQFGFQHLSDSLTGCTALLRKIKAGSSQLASFPAGQALSHAFAIARRALSSGSHFRVVCENGVYAGAVLFGSNIACCIHGQIHKALSVEVLLQEVTSVNAHEASLKKIVALIRRITKDEDGMVPLYDIGVRDIDTSRKMANIMRSLSRVATYEVTDFEKLVLDEIENLRFTDRYWEPTQANILKFLRFIVSGEEALLGDAPCYLGGRLLQHAGSKIHFGLAAFGPIVPSINIGRAKETRFNFPGLDKEDVNLTMDKEKKRFLQYLPFQKTPIQSAAVQWKSMFNNGYFMIPVGRKGKTEFTNTTRVDVKIATEPFFTEAYSLMKQEANAIRASIQTGKRKRSDDDDESGPGASTKKGRKELGEVAMDV